MAEDQDHSLGLAFMRGHPAQAARVLEAIAPADAAALFAHVPARIGAAVLAAMLPQRAARCIAELGDERSLELLAPMGTQPTVAVLRHLPEPRRRSLIAGLPTAASLASTLLLGYAEETLGAWADPDVLVLPPDTRAGQALERVKLAENAHAAAFVADGDRRLIGVVEVPALLRAPVNATLATLMRRPAAVLTAHAPLSATSSHPGWALSSALPVVEPGERLVGVLTRDALTRALRRAEEPSQWAAEATLPVLFARGYWQALSGLVESGLKLLPRAPELEARPDDH